MELLRLRFHENRPIRDIASLWGEDAARLHHEYARARREFQQALRDTVAEYVDDVDGALDRECRELIESLA